MRVEEKIEKEINIYLFDINSTQVWLESDLL